MKNKKNFLLIVPIFFVGIFFSLNYAKADTLSASKVGSGSCPNCQRGYLINTNANYSTARSGSAGSKASGGDVQTSAGYTVARTYIMFDTSSIGASSTVDSAQFTFSENPGSVSNTDNTSGVVVGATVSSPYLLTSDFSNYGNTVLGTFNIAAGTQHVNFNGAGLSYINKTGYTSLAFLTALDFNNQMPTGSNNLGWFTASSSFVINFTTNVCTSFTYTDWSACTASSTQTRSVTANLPLGCNVDNITPVTSQSCVYTPPPPPDPPYITDTKNIGGSIVNSSVNIATISITRFWPFILAIIVLGGLISLAYQFTKKVSDE